MVKQRKLVAYLNFNEYPSRAPEHASRWAVLLQATESGIESALQAVFRDWGQPAYFKSQ